MKSFAASAFALCLITSASAAGQWEQCGGADFQGSASCIDGWKCVCQSQYYSQCLPPNQATPQGWGDGCTSSKGQTTLPRNTESSTSGSCSAFSGNKAGYATTTRYYDGFKGACGCGDNSGMFSWQLGSGSVWTAAGSASLFDNGGSSTWCGSGCGGCYELENVGAIAADGQGGCTGKGEKITVQLTNLCPAQGNEQWCASPSNQYGFGAHFDIMAQGKPASGWDNPVVKYTKVACPSTLASNYQRCECVGQSRVRRGLFQDKLA